jgi:uncharacterized protein (TIGR02444 family)
MAADYSLLCPLKPIISSEESAVMHSNLFWSYSLEVYQRSGVSIGLLDLQNRFGIDVNMVLCCCWLGASQNVLTQSHAAQLINHCRSWRENCLLPIRSARLYLKAQSLVHKQSSVHKLYNQTKTLELEAERWQQDLMYQYLQPMELKVSTTASCEQVLGNLKAYTDCLAHVKWEQVKPLYRELVMCF